MRRRRLLVVVGRTVGAWGLRVGLGLNIRTVRSLCGSDRVSADQLSARWVATAGFQHEHPRASFRQTISHHGAGYTSTDHDNVEVACAHFDPFGSLSGRYRQWPK